MSEESTESLEGVSDTKIDIKKEIIADFQIHSRYARACSKNTTIDKLEEYGRMKGIDILGTGDFQHPEWRKEINEKLIEDNKGILRTSNGFPFIWQTEISLMYSDKGKNGEKKRRAVHLLIFAPNTEVADRITDYLGSKGRLDYDGRPIFGMTCRDLVKDLKDIDDRIEIIPAHVMTPWFGLYGSKSGFDSLKQCFGDQIEKIYAIESGISADPEMLWRMKEVCDGKVNVVSFSDAHSFWPWRLGREATLFEFEELSYDNFIKAIRTGEGLKATIETPPEYGRYHWDGHRNCNFSCSPIDSKKMSNKCPRCGKSLTIGVEYRALELAKMEKGYIPVNAKPFYKLVPLHEIIAFYLGSSMNTQKTWNLYNSLIKEFGSEFNVLLRVEKDKLIRFLTQHKDLVGLIIDNRIANLKIKPGFDGEYGKIMLKNEQ